MKLYGEANPAPNPRRVRIFAAEKGLDLPEIRIGLRQGGHKSPEHRARNSLGQVPVLELDDGQTISESVAICRYLELLHPTPPLFGTCALSQARTDMWVRRIEFQLMIPAAMYWRHAHPLTASLLVQNRDFGESNRPIAAKAMDWLDRELADGREWIAGDTFGMADIVALTTIDFAGFIGLEVPHEAERLKVWRERASTRPSARA
ncbi:glutathione S-transferase family protein [Caulobacter sp. BK020]|uniref:glutathione S-transferase family protein n=1 Tax=Caulobacter sp. BK020 TaxID=2512117 RepID=UPI001044D810|nr:glutathione S-transferase family protein [Caulobacter sp. BK020]TCS14092.1 glutathione S-transferase [Caulobacter sp. BK020]